MHIYKIKAKDAQGNVIEESINAETQREVIDILHRRGVTVIDIEKIRAGIRGKGARVRPEELVVFSRQLSTMVSAGLPLIEALKTLQEQIEKAGLKHVVNGIVSQVEGGASFADSIRLFPNVFGTFYISMVQAGEASGRLSEILLRVADYVESTNSLKRKIRMAMVYPAIVSIMAGLITVILLLKVIPVFEGVFADIGADLPMPTQILISFSRWFRRWFLVISSGGAFGMFMLARFGKTPRGRFIMDRFKFRMPVFGALFQKVAISRFARTLGTLVQSGVPILNAFGIVKEISGNILIEKAVDDAAAKIREGKSIEEPLKKSGVFPVMVTKMISVGEKSGRLDEMLNKIAGYYDEQVSAAVAGLSDLIEPLLIGFLGIVVGGIVFCMYLPIFKLSAVIAK